MDKKLIIKDVRGWLNLLYHRVCNEIEADHDNIGWLSILEFDREWTSSDMALFYLENVLIDMRKAFNSSKLADEIINEKELENGTSNIPVQIP